MSDKAPQIVTPKQERALVKLLAGGTDAQAAKAASVNRRTVFEWRHDDPVFAAEYRRRQETMFDRAMRGLLSDVDKATRTVRNLTSAKDESVRLRAAESVIDRVASFLGGIPGGKERMVQALGVQVNVNAAPPGDIRRLTPDERLEFERLTRKYEGIVDVESAAIVRTDPA